MSAIDIVFVEVSDGTHSPYVEQKIRAMFAALDGIPGTTARNRLTQPKLTAYAAGIRAGLRRMDVRSIPLARRHDVGRLTAGQRRVVNQRIRCLIESVNAQFPLLDGEHVLDDGDLATYLSRAWRGYSRHTAVLRRKTNLATTYYFVHDTVVNLRRRRVEIAMPEAVGRERGLGAAYTPAFGNAARELAKALAGLAEPPFNMIGAFLINAFWPTGSGAATNWDEVYANLQLIIKNQLAENEVKQAAVKVRGFATFLANEYVELKKSARKRPGELLAALQPYDTAFFLDIVNRFMFADKPTSDVATASLANFMIGANLHIALNQERALVDPAYCDDPSRSPYALTASNLAKTYAAYARAAAPAVVKLRQAQVTGLKSSHETHCQGGPAAHCTTIWSYWFEDNNPKPKYKSKEYSYVDGGKGSHDDAKPQALQARKAYLAKIERDLNLKQQVYDVAAFWDKIAENPISMAYAAPTTAPSLDPDGWAATTPVRGSRRWRDGYRVRYAVSFFQGGKETDKGPWWTPKGADASGYLAGTPNALPTLTEIPVDPFYHADGRVLYRQFDGAREERIARIDDNQTTRHQDMAK